MAGLMGSDDDDVISDINITPFVDIVLVLLIIFMVTSTYITRAAIEVELPKAASGGQAVDNTLNLVITKDGQLLLNGAPTDRDAIVAAIKEGIKTTPKLQAVIAADKGVEYGEVVSMIDLVKLNGITSFALNIERTPAPSNDADAQKP